MTASILILDDEQEIADLVELYLQNEDFTILQDTISQVLNATDITRPQKL